MADLYKAYSALPAPHKKHVYLIATAQESQQAEHKTKFCQRAGNGAGVAECTSDKISTNWFSKDPAPRYIIWWYRNPDNSCKWKYGGRYSTNNFGDVQARLQHTLSDLLSKSAACTGLKRVSTTTKKPVKTTSGFVWQQVDSNGQCDEDDGEVYLKTSPRKVASLEKCKKTCEDCDQCKSITFFKSKFCSHFSTECKKIKRRGRAKSMRLVPRSSIRTRAPKSVHNWVKVRQGHVCDTKNGEVYLDQSPGRVGSLKQCQTICEQDPDCKSIAFFRSRWCSLYSTPCNKVRRRGKVQASYRLVTTRRQLRQS